MPWVLTWNRRREWLTGGPPNLCTRSRLLGWLGQPCRVASGLPEEDPASKQGAFAGEAPPIRQPWGYGGARKHPWNQGARTTGLSAVKTPKAHRECAESSRRIWKHAGHTDTHTHTHTRTFSLGFISSDIYKKPRILNTLVPWILATNTRAPSPGQRAWASVSNTPHSVYVSEPTSWGWREITLQGGAVTITRSHYLLERTLLF